VAHRAAHRIQARRVRLVEIGYRPIPLPDTEPALTSGTSSTARRFQRKPEESMLTGDQNMIEPNATVHYNLAAPTISFPLARW
jgi:hypothetical protein